MYRKFSSGKNRLIEFRTGITGISYGMENAPGGMEGAGGSLGLPRLVKTCVSALSRNLVEHISFIAQSVSPISVKFRI